MNLREALVAGEAGGVLVSEGVVAFLRLFLDASASIVAAPSTDLNLVHFGAPSQLSDTATCGPCC